MSEVIDAFHKLYYEGAHQTTYLGIPLWKSPTDLFVYQETICQTQPNLIVETGTAHGGSALFFANLFDAAGIDGRVISIDIEDGDNLPRHERITYLRGLSSLDPRVLEYVKGRKAGRVMVILDSDHGKHHVQAELEAYSGLVTKGCALVVEDVNVNGHPVLPDFGPGPYEALEAWLPDHPEFVATHLWNKYLQTFHGWLQRT